MKNELDAIKKYEKPAAKTLDKDNVLKAVNEGSKFPARGFAG